MYSLTTFNWLRLPGGDEDVDRISPAWPLARVLDGAAASGSPGVGLDSYSVAEHVRTGGRIEDVGAMLRSRGLVCTDVGALLLAEEDTLASACMFAWIAAFTAAPVCIAAVYSPKPRVDVVRDLRMCADVLRDSGMRLALEFTAYGGLVDLASAVELCETVGWERCGVLVDSLHFFRTGEPWEQLRSLDGDQIALVHLDDVSTPSDADPMRESRFRRLPPGAGVLPLAAFRDAVAATGYRGVVSAEVLSPRLRALPPEVGARELMDALRRAWPQELPSGAATS